MAFRYRPVFRVVAGLHFLDFLKVGVNFIFKLTINRVTQGNLRIRLYLLNESVI